MLFIVGGNWVVFYVYYFYEISHWDVGAHTVYMRDVSPQVFVGCICFKSSIRLRGTYSREERCIQDFDGET
jgi:hypothetical protein